ncbi:hypothetical protein PanWU01x14_281140 [Parasponia andersonii]|uniref:Uncharacterized protein n=1 Tax=Parasponia andersonii TaxID=3476 RepID=A0A2P5B1A4_PARAD|nr:hypothetical protein PanWU01x14_281140 [Parasponia andersonii]
MKSSSSSPEEPSVAAVLSTNGYASGQVFGVEVSDSIAAERRQSGQFPLEGPAASSQGRMQCGWKIWTHRGRVVTRWWARNRLRQMAHRSGGDKRAISIS